MKTDRERSQAKNLHERVQELTAEYWHARTVENMSERLAIAQTHLYLAAMEGFTSEGRIPDYELLVVAEMQPK